MNFGAAPSLLDKKWLNIQTIDYLYEKTKEITEAERDEYCLVEKLILSFWDKFAEETISGEKLIIDGLADIWIPESCMPVDQVKRTRALMICDVEIKGRGPVPVVGTVFHLIRGLRRDVRKIRLESNVCLPFAIDFETC